MQVQVSPNVRTTMIPDVQGSIIGTLNTGPLSLISKSGYQPFGNNTTTTSGTSGTFRYTGQRFDAETAGSSAEPSGLYYYRTRMYSPTLGRFMQPDTIGYQDSLTGMNLYAYGGNDPLDNEDPDGRCYPVCTAIAGAAVGGFIGGVGYTWYNWNDFTWGGFAARTAQGATIGGLAGAGLELPALIAAGAGANVTATFIQQASQGSLQIYYGESWGENTAQVLTDAVIGGGSVLAGVGLSNVLTPAVNDALGTFGADVLGNVGVSNETAATVISTINASSGTISQGTEALGDVGSEYLSEWTIDTLSQFSIQNAPSDTSQAKK